MKGASTKLDQREIVVGMANGCINRNAVRHIGHRDNIPVDGIYVIHIFIRIPNIRLASTNEFLFFIFRFVTYLEIPFERH